MNVFETAFWALKALKKSATGDSTPEAAPESNTEFISRTVDLTPGIPHWNKGLILERRGDKVNAIAAYRDAVRAVPHYYDAHANLTRLLCESDQWDEAIKHGEMAVRLKRNSPKVHNNLSVAFYNKGQIPKALRHCATALQLAPTDVDLIDNLIQMRNAHPDMAKAPDALAAEQLWLEVAEKHYEQGVILLGEQKAKEAIAAWRLTIRLAPEWAEPIGNLAAVLATHPDDAVRSGKEALELAQKAMQLGDRSAQYFDVLAAAYANCARFLEARRTIEQILPAVRENGPLESAVKLAERLQLYQQRLPLRQEFPIIRTGTGAMRR